MSEHVLDQNDQPSGLPPIPPPNNDSVYALWGDSFSGLGIYGTSYQNGGVVGRSNDLAGVTGASVDGVGVSGFSQNSVGVIGNSTGVPPGTGALTAGVVGQNLQEFGGYGVSGYGGNIGVYAENTTVSGIAAYLGTKSLAGDFYGEVFFHNTITKQGGGFQIDHPLEPARKYLSHSFVESPDMKNIYDGIVVLDERGEAKVELPAWFEALNTEFRYQLTCIGGYAPVYIAQEFHDQCFTIAGGKAGMRISWQVTGIRQDAWANSYRIQVESEKPAEEQGTYLAPELHGESAEKSIRWVRYPRQG